MSHVRIQKVQIMGPRIFGNIEFRTPRDHAVDQITPMKGIYPMQRHLKKTADIGEQSIECLGITFSNENARRKHFLQLLAKKLEDPDFRSLEGFPNGTDEDILAMSDPPYYTACPNPWLSDFVKFQSRPYDPSENYSREPMSIDVSVGKTDPLYKAHSYHTKVPHLAIVPSILNFTEPGDVVLDGFSGSGMTGVAAQWCDRPSSNYRLQLEQQWKNAGRKKPKWGARKVILSDLSPAATFISANYNIPFNVADFAEAGRELLDEIENEVGWMYQTNHADSNQIGNIEYTVWSEIFRCLSCGHDILFTDTTINATAENDSKNISCPKCQAVAKKEHMDLVFETYVDHYSGKAKKRPKRVPVLISYKIDGKKYVKKPDAADLRKLRQINKMPIPGSIPFISLPDSQMRRVGRMKTTNVREIIEMFLPRPLQTLGLMWSKANSHHDHRIRNFLKFMTEQGISPMSVLNRFRVNQKSQSNQVLSGVFYVPSQIAEISIKYRFERKLTQISNTFSTLSFKSGDAIISTGSTEMLSIPDSSVDYIFTDPPFGENIYYADLNFLVESWHNVYTDVFPEAIIDRVREKQIPDYQRRVHNCFSEYYRVLKPGRWITVIFSNSKASVWNAIQVALQQSGFIIASVSALDKVQGSFKQVTSTTAVKQDLVISAYKPDYDLEREIGLLDTTSESVWNFVQAHLHKLPTVKITNGRIEAVIERDPRRIYDRMVAWFVLHGHSVPLSTEEFMDLLYIRFTVRDNMTFLPDQAVEYDRIRSQIPDEPQVELFVCDERSSIDWLTAFLRKRPATYQEIHPEFMVQIGAGWRKHEVKPELSNLLEYNFLRYEGIDDVPRQIQKYLSKNYKHFRGLSEQDRRLKKKARGRWYVPNPGSAKDLEQKREKSLLKEFDAYITARKRDLKESRIEVLRAGFKALWMRQDYATIISISEKLPNDTIQEDEKLLLWYDQALTRTENRS